VEAATRALATACYGREQVLDGLTEAVQSLEALRNQLPDAVVCAKGSLVLYCGGWVSNRDQSRARGSW
jgi:hypothetical protein